MFQTISGWRRTAVAIPLTGLLAALAGMTPASADENTLYRFEETAAANWSVPHRCADGSTVQARLLVQSTRDYEAPDTEDTRPTARVQYQAVCSGFSFSWAAPVAPATITSTNDLKSVTASGTALARDNGGQVHQVTFDVAWSGYGPLETRVNPTQGFLVGTFIEKERAATATGRVTFDGDPVVNGEANHRITPFIRTEEDRYASPPN